MNDEDLRELSQTFIIYIVEIISDNGHWNYYINYNGKTSLYNEKIYGIS